MRTILLSTLSVLFLVPAPPRLHASAIAPSVRADQIDDGAGHPPDATAADSPSPGPAGGFQPAPPVPAAATASDSTRALRTAMRALQRVNRFPGLSLSAALEQLDEHAGVIPGDDWITGHRVGLRVALDELDDALRVARDCTASDWWCAALLGFVLHVRGEIGPAEAAFDHALDAMPANVRCAWLEELRHVLSGELARQFRGADCEERTALERHAWWLADPLFLVPHNERRTEHLSRIVSMVLHHQWIGDGGYCPPDHHDPIVAGGWSPWWDEMYATRGGLPASGGYRFLPAGAEWASPISAGASDWDLHPGTTDERYAPPDREYHRLPAHQMAYFARGDSAIVVAAIGRTDHELAEQAGLRVGLYLAASPDADAVVLTEENPPGSARFRAAVPAGPHLASIEIVSSGDGAARARFTVGPPAAAADRPWMSDLLLYAWDESAEASLDDVASRTFAGSRIPESAHVGIYWEIYGISADDAVETAVVVTPRQGFFGRLASALRLASRDEVRTSWLEHATTQGFGFSPRSLGVDLAGLSPGRYQIELTVTLGSGDELTTSREIEIAD